MGGEGVWRGWCRCAMWWGWGEDGVGVLCGGVGRGWYRCALWEVGVGGRCVGGGCMC